MFFNSLSLIAKFFIFNCYLVAHANISNEEFDRKNEEIAKPFISSLNTIRVYVGSSPGMGHQQNTFAIMNYLRTIGFSGVFEIVYDDSKYTELQTGTADISTAEKMTKFVNKFNPQLQDVQKFESQGIVTIPKTMIYKHPEQWPIVELAITGGQDFSSITATFMRSQAFLDLYPTGFIGPHRESISLASPDGIYNLHDYPGDAFTNYSVPIIIEKDLNKISKKLIGSSTAVDSVLRMLESNKFDFMPIYGLKGYKNLGDGFAVKQTVNLIESVNSAYSDIDRNHVRSNVALLILNQLNETELQDFKKQLKESNSNVKIVDLRRQSLLMKPKTTNSSPEVVVYITGGLPSELFNYILATSRIPPLGGGANFYSIMKTLGRPYLSTQEVFSIMNNFRPEWVKDNLYGIKFLDEIENEVKKINESYSELVGGKKSLSLTSFIKSCLRQEKMTLDLFNPNPHKHLQPNKVLVAIRTAYNLLIHYNTIPPIQVLQQTETEISTLNQPKSCMTIF